MENTTKIDIIKDSIFCYNEQKNERKDYPLTEEFNAFLKMFSDTQDMLSVNISDPISRIVKFYKIENSIPQHFVELPYVEMTQEEKEIFDTFVKLILSK